MKNWLKSFDKSILVLLKDIGYKAHTHGLSAFVVGGFVRDVILNRRNLDLDIVVDADVIPLAQQLSQEYNASLIVYKQFKTATVSFADGLKIDFASARKETYPHNGALPVVSLGSIRDDLYRRDFTVNAMAFSIAPDHFGELRDDFNGFEDLMAKKIRILHPQSFWDDPTRILRAVRFEQRFDFRIEKRTLSMLKFALRNNAVQCVKQPRYFEEFKKILSEENPPKFLKRLYSLRGLDFLHINRKNVFKNFRLMHNVSREIAWLYHQSFHSKKMNQWLVYFMAFMDNSPQDKLKRLLTNFHFKREDQAKMLSGKNFSSVLKRLEKKDLKPSQILGLLKPLSCETIIILKAKASNRWVKKYIEDFFLKYDAVSLHIDGNDLIHLGVGAGERVGIILKKILSSKVNGEIHTHEEELRKAKQLALGFKNS